MQERNKVVNAELKKHQTTQAVELVRLFGFVSIIQFVQNWENSTDICLSSKSQFFDHTYIVNIGALSLVDVKVGSNLVFFLH